MKAAAVCWCVFVSTSAQVSSEEFASPDQAQHIITQYRTTVRGLERALFEHWKEGKAHTPSRLISIARELRAVNCAPLLVDHISDLAPAGFETGPLSTYPAAQALVEFGSPSFLAISDRLDRPATERELRILALVLQQIDGNAVAIDRLEQMWKDDLESRNAKGGEQARSKNLKRLLEILTTVDFTRQENWPVRLK